VIKYLGSKRKLLGAITATVGALAPPPSRVLDLFSGTARVGHALKRAGHQVTSNDLLTYAAVLARCYVGADARQWRATAEVLLAELAEAPPVDGYFTETFCRKARYFQPHNGERIEGIRKAIAERDLAPELEAIVLTSLMEAADRVDSTTGVQMAFLKRWAKRSFNPLRLRLPDLTDGEGAVLQREAVDAAPTPADVCYLDPPYNQHSYLGNYHVWETLARGDEPEPYGVAQKRSDVRERRSAFNSKRRIEDALRRTLEAVAAPHLVLSFSDEGYLSTERIEAMLREVRPYVGRAGTAYDRYVGAKIGIHDPKGRRVGAVGHLKNREQLFIASADPDAVRRAVEAAASRLAPMQIELL
jgi:adenine-specific DNA-methyltransferase